MIRYYAYARLIRSVVGLGSRLQIVFGLVLVVSLISGFSPVRAQLRPVSNEQTRQTTGIKVTSLKVRIVTQRSRGAGTDNAVYFDVGPVAWKLGRSLRNDFEAGNDDTYDLKVPEGLTTDEILWVRLHKKGIFGVTGTKDGFAGAWHPESVTLLVNDVEFVKITPAHALNSRCWYWRAPSPVNWDLRLFARSLRIRPNDKLSFTAKALAFLTTNLFKKNGISGWISDPQERECGGVIQDREVSDSVRLCADGEITRKASSTDGLRTIDMRVTQIDLCPDENKPCVKRIVLNHDNGFRLARYLRIESRFRAPTTKGRRSRICGQLLWDTDREGWWEIHPRTADDLRVPAETSPRSN